MTPHYTRKLKVCERCKHHVSAHKWDPERDARKGPFECSVPGCTCQKFLRHDEKYVKAKSEAWLAVVQDETIVYDACANAGVMKDNTPPQQLLRIVAEFILEGS